MNGVMISWIVNTSFRSPEKPVQPSDFMTTQPRWAKSERQPSDKVRMTAKRRQGVADAFRMLAKMRAPKNG